MDYQKIYDSVDGDKRDFMIKCGQLKLGLSYKKASEHVECHSQFDSYRHKWNDLAPDSKKNRPEQEKKRIEHSPHEQGKLKMKKIIEIARGIKEDKEINLTMNLQ